MTSFPMIPDSLLIIKCQQRYDYPKVPNFFDGFVKELYCKSLWKLSLWEGDFSSDANSWDNKQGSSCTTGCNKGAPVVTHTQTITHTDIHKGNTTHIHLCTPTCCQVPPEFGVQTGRGNNWGSIQNARSGVFDMTTVRNGEVKVAAGRIMKNSQRWWHEPTEYCSQTWLLLSEFILEHSSYL